MKIVGGYIFISLVENLLVIDDFLVMFEYYMELYDMENVKVVV